MPVDLVTVDRLEFERAAEEIAHVLGHAALDLRCAPARRSGGGAAPTRSRAADRRPRLPAGRGRRRASPGRGTSRGRACPGKSTSRWCAIRSSSSTKRRSLAAPPSTGTKRGSVGGIFTRAKCSSTPVARRLFELDGKREREIRDIRERMAAIDRERRQHRKDALVEGSLERALRLVVELAPRAADECLRARAPAAGRR